MVFDQLRADLKYRINLEHRIEHSIKGLPSTKDEAYQILQEAKEFNANQPFYNCVRVPKYRRQIEDKLQRTRNAELF